MGGCDTLPQRLKNCTRPTSLLRVAEEEREASTELEVVDESMAEAGEVTDGEDGEYTGRSEDKDTCRVRKGQRYIFRRAKG